MPKPNNDELVKCPFYISMDSTSITCEGITDDCVCKLIFKGKESKNQQRKIFCSEHYENCEIYQMLWRKYED